MCDSESNTRSRAGLGKYHASTHSTETKKILNYDYVTVIYDMAIGYQFPSQFGQNNKSSQNNK